jgi:hypothetical protein
MGGFLQSRFKISPKPTINPMNDCQLEKYIRFGHGLKKSCPVENIYPGFLLISQTAGVTD